jgi:hypothetical protein
MKLFQILFIAIIAINFIVGIGNNKIFGFFFAVLHNSAILLLRFRFNFDKTLDKTSLKIRDPLKLNLKWLMSKKEMPRMPLRYVLFPF